MNGKVEVSLYIDEYGRVEGAGIDLFPSISGVACMYHDYISKTWKSPMEEFIQKIVEKVKEVKGKIEDREKEVERAKDYLEGLGYTVRIKHA